MLLVRWTHWTGYLTANRDQDVSDWGGGGGGEGGWWGAGLLFKDMIHLLVSLLTIFLLFCVLYLNCYLKIMLFVIPYMYICFLYIYVIYHEVHLK